MSMIEYLIQFFSSPSIEIQHEDLKRVIDYLKEDNLSELIKFYKNRTKFNYSCENPHSLQIVIYNKDENVKKSNLSLSVDYDGRYDIYYIGLIQINGEVIFREYNIEINLINYYKDDKCYYIINQHKEIIGLYNLRTEEKELIGGIKLVI